MKGAGVKTVALLVVALALIVPTFVVANHSGHHQVQGKPAFVLFEGEKIEVGVPVPKRNWDRALVYADRTGHQLYIRHAALRPKGDYQHYDVSCWGCRRGWLTLNNGGASPDIRLRYEGIRGLELHYADGCGGPCARIPYP